MKKIYAILILIGLFVGSQVLADVVTTTRKINRPTTQQYHKPTTQQYHKPTTTPSRTTGSRLSDSVKNCRPYSETMVTDMGGVNFGFKVTIGGWINNKCRLDFVSDAQGIASSFEQIYGVSASQAQISTFAPKVRCNFTKQQLAYVGDSILQEEARKNGGNGRMLKNPNQISLGGFSDSDARLLDVLMNDRACTILNANDLGNMLQSIMGF